MPNEGQPVTEPLIKISLPFISMKHVSCSLRCLSKGIWCDDFVGKKCHDKFS